MSNEGWATGENSATAQQSVTRWSIFVVFLCVPGRFSLSEHAEYESANLFVIESKIANMLNMFS